MSASQQYISIQHIICKHYVTFILCIKSLVQTAPVDYVVSCFRSFDLIQWSENEHWTISSSSELNAMRNAHFASHVPHLLTWNPWHPDPHGLPYTTASTTKKKCDWGVGVCTAVHSAWSAFQVSWSAISTMWLPCLSACLSHKNAIIWIIGKSWLQI